MPVYYSLGPAVIGVIKSLDVIVHPVAAT